MNIIIWRDSFNTGDRLIDSQHKKLVQIINELFTYLGEEKNTTKIEEIFVELYKYTFEHFSVEEKIMQENNYPKYINHKTEHEYFTNKVVELKNKFSENNIFKRLVIRPY